MRITTNFAKDILTHRSQRPLVISSAGPLPEHVLVGHAFDGTNLILGDDGYEAFRKVTGRLVEPGGDGSYLVLNRKGSRLRIGCDHAGYTTMFLYQHKRNWAVSNSYLDLVRFVANQTTWQLTRDHLNSMNIHISGPIGLAPTTRHTDISEISHVAPGWDLVQQVGWTEWRVVQRLRDTGCPIKENHVQSRAALQNFVLTWVGRLCTLLNSEVDITCDITGGRDSRTVLAMLLAAARITGRNPGESVHYMSNRKHELDFSIAKTLSEAFELNLENPVRNHFDHLRIGAEFAFESWKRFTFCAYYPIYFPTVARHPNHVWIGGGGGESHRKITGIGTAESAERLLRRSKKNFPSDKDYTKYRERFEKDLSRLQVGRSEDFDFVKLHYRNYRERFHHGRGSLYRYRLSPLAGRHLRDASDSASEDYWNSGRFLAEVIAATTPELLSLPFDKAHEGFDATVLSDFDPRGFSLQDVDTSGRVFRGNDADTTVDSTRENPATLRALSDLFHECEASDRIRAEFSAETLKMARLHLNAAVEAGRLSDQTLAKSATQIIQVHEVEKLMRNRGKVA